MFGRTAESGTGERHGHSILQEGVSLKGEMEAKGDLRLDGRLDGKLVVTERLTVGAGGVLIAEVEAGEVIVMGSIQGKVRAHRRLELRKGARVLGDITTPVLLIEEGVHFHGNSNMETEAGTSPLLSPAIPVPSGREVQTKQSEESSYDQVYH